MFKTKFYIYLVFIFNKSPAFHSLLSIWTFQAFLYTRNDLSCTKFTLPSKFYKVYILYQFSPNSVVSVQYASITTFSSNHSRSKLSVSKLQNLYLALICKPLTNFSTRIHMITYKILSHFYKIAKLQNINIIATISMFILCSLYL